MNDQIVIDRIATLLGTSEEWSGADMLEFIADLIGDVRPHPGNCEAGEYRSFSGLSLDVSVLLSA